MEVNTKVLAKSEWRSSSEAILPQTINTERKKTNGYTIYPYHALGNGKINNGYQTLVSWIIEQKTVCIEGFIGVFWDDVYYELNEELQKKGIAVNWVFMTDSMKGSAEIQKLVDPFLGDQGSVWGTKATLALSDFFYADQLLNEKPDQNFAVNIAIGIGSSLLAWNAPVVYFDLPKAEAQYRFRAGAVTNFGSTKIEGQSEAYKRSYFVDWPVLNTYKAQILNKISIVADAQWKDSINWMFNSDLQQGLKDMSKSVFRVRPWFEAGAWGGHWMQDRFEGLNKEEVNYAWSFELIVPENGLVFESDGNLLEVSFDFLMFAQSKAVLGKHATVFGTEFPIRFDFLDTFDGGNLSIQCHPSLDYIQKEFGENITQDETYYILDCKPNAEVFLGFQENIDPKQFEAELEASQELSKEIDITKYVQSHTAKKHDLFLIPNGTVHSAGADNLVLEISATPYIFTFKMYDWMRMGLNGQPRPINIDHAFKNLNFERKGNRVKEELISKPTLIEKGADWQLIHLPTHKDHFYDVHRIEFETEITIKTNNTCHILMLVEGTTLHVETENGVHLTFNYAETFVIPAAANSYKLINADKTKAKVIKAFVKDDIKISFN
ncbi:class I mannose-6-phosphate isomerase [Pedobacter sp. Du54]|uniref:class I mannose-6-phosphate isomerase n=1 Tax=Pedobacter anseongensis TaxID=3133439 RepID=UPI0030A535B1